MDIQAYWKATLSQEPLLMKEYFAPNAYIRWHNTNEHFNVDEFIQANCEYPNKWDGEIERLEQLGELMISVVHVFTMDQSLSFHVTSFIKIANDKIISIDEYWGEDGVVPQWRLDKKIGTKII